MTVEQRFHPVGFDRRRAVEQMQSSGLSGMLLVSPENVQYTTGYCSLPSSGNPILYALRNRLPYFSYIDGDGAVTLGCWEFSAEGVDYGADTLAGFNDFDGAVQAVKQVVARNLPPGGLLGLESTCPRFVVGALDANVGDCDDVIDRLRLIKTDTELALIRKSTNIIEAAVAELYPMLDVGLTRNELMRRARVLLMEGGASGISHLTFSFGHTNPEVEVAEPLLADALVTLDLGGIYQGYCSDNRRYAYTGEVPADLERRYRAMVEIVDRVGAMLTPGTEYSAISRRSPRVAPRIWRRAACALHPRGPQHRPRNRGGVARRP